jgi:hypothetical protein
MKKSVTSNDYDVDQRSYADVHEGHPEEGPVPSAHIGQPSVPSRVGDAPADPVETRVREEKAQANRDAHATRE